MGLQKTLEILIPTFGRPKSASNAIDCIIKCQDQRFSIRCNSNGHEPLLEKYRSLNTQVNYDSFDQYLGPHKNILHLLKSTDAKFCMLLSDEDRLDPDRSLYFNNDLLKRKDIKKSSSRARRFSNK